MNMKVNRRNFLKTSALTGVALMGGGLSSGVGQPAYGSTRNETEVRTEKIPVTAQADIVVIGGGPGGFGAAIRAARMGAKTILIDRYDVPGGVHTTGLQGAYNEGVGGVHTELMERFDQGRLRVHGYGKGVPGVGGQSAFTL